jgi:hypothetical protein
MFDQTWLGQRAAPDKREGKGWSDLGNTDASRLLLLLQLVHFSHIPYTFVMPVAVQPPTAPGGIKLYYQAKIEAAEITINRKTQNLRRLEAQRNALNARGSYKIAVMPSPAHDMHQSDFFVRSSSCFTSRAAMSARS